MGSYELRSGYGKMAGQILNACNLNDQRTRDVLALVGYLRNSLHNNGMHRGPDLTIDIADMQYRLRKDMLSGRSRNVALRIRGMMGYGMAVRKGLLRRTKISPAPKKPFRRDQTRSKRSRFITLVHAATKSLANFSFESAHA
jgi:hypothetical protein